MSAEIRARGLPRLSTIGLVATTLAVMLPRCALAQAPVDLPTWLNETLDRIVATRIEQTSSSTQLQPPSLSRGLASVIDHASASDVAGLALVPPGVPRGSGDDREATAQTVTVTPYALLSALLGVRPGDPWHYQDNSAWRVLSLSVGFEDASADSIPGDEHALLAGVKLKIWNPRDVDPGDARVQELRETFLRQAGAAFGRLSTQIQDMLIGFATPTPADTIAFLNELATPEGFAVVLERLSDEQVRALHAAVENAIEPFVALDRASAALVDELRGAAQLSLAFDARLSEIGGDAYRVGLVLDRALVTGLDWTLNGAFEIREGIAGLDERKGASFGSQISGQLGAPELTGASGARLSLAAKGLFLEGTDSQVSVQAEISLPLAPGLYLPISLTWANRTELIEEDALIGNVAFTVDTSLLLQALGG